MKALISLIAIGALAQSCTWFTALTVARGVVDNYPSDWVGEEVLEEYIEDKTGVDIDLSPFSPEK